MERWQEIFVGKIPKGVYQMQMGNGEYQGMVIELLNDYVHVTVQFGVVRAVRMLDEGMVQSGVYSDTEIEKYKKDDFQNVIYEVQNGGFLKQINEISDGYAEALNLKHYVLITQNYNVDVVTEWEPSLEVKQMGK